MILFKSQQIYDKYTGKPLSKEFIPDKYLCDYCGEIISEYGYPVDHLERTYTVNETDGQEPWFDQMSLSYKDKKVDLYELFNKHPNFVYCCDYDQDWFCEAKMLYEEALKEEGDVRKMLFVDLMYSKRLEMLEKVFETYSLEDFGLGEEN